MTILMESGEIYASTQICHPWLADKKTDDRL